MAELVDSFLSASLMAEANVNRKQKRECVEVEMPIESNVKASVREMQEGKKESVRANVGTHLADWLAERGFPVCP